MNFQNGKYYSYAILGNEDRLVFARHKEHPRTKNQEWCIYEKYLDNIVVQRGTETTLRSLIGEFGFVHVPGRYQQDKTDASQREHCFTECFGYSKVVISCF